MGKLKQPNTENTVLTRNQMQILRVVIKNPGCYAQRIDEGFADLEESLGVRLFRDAHKTLKTLEKTGLVSSALDPEWRQPGHPPRRFTVLPVGVQCLEFNEDLDEAVADADLGLGVY